MNEVQSSNPFTRCTAEYSANTAASKSPAVARSERRDSSHMNRSHMPHRCKAHRAARLPQAVRASGGRTCGNAISSNMSSQSHAYACRSTLIISAMKHQATERLLSNSYRDVSNLSMCSRLKSAVSSLRHDCYPQRVWWLKARSCKMLVQQRLVSH